VTPVAKDTDWTRPWLLIRLVLVWCAAAATWIIVWGQDDGVRETSMMAVAGLAGSVILGYLGFGTWDARNLIVARRGRSFAPPPEEPPEAQ